MMSAMVSMTAKGHNTGMPLTLNEKLGHARKKVEHRDTHERRQHRGAAPPFQRDQDHGQQEQHDDVGRRK